MYFKHNILGIGVAISVMFIWVPKLAASPCDADVEKYCGTVQPGMGTISDCMQRNVDKMSHQCREWMRKMDSSLGRLSACSSAARDYCRDIRPGYRRVHACLNNHFDKLPVDCQEALKAVGR